MKFTDLGVELDVDFFPTDLDVELDADFFLATACSDFSSEDNFLLGLQSFRVKIRRNFYHKIANLTFPTFTSADFFPHLAPIFHRRMILATDLGVELDVEITSTTNLRQAIVRLYAFLKR